MKVNQPPQTEYKPMPKGNRIMRLIQIIDLGTQEAPDGKKSAQQFWLYEAPKLLAEDGKPMTVGEFVYMSTNSKAKLMNRLVNWLGQEFPKGQEKQFGFFYKVPYDFTTYKFVGSYGRVTTSINEAGKATIDAISALNEDDVAPASDTPLFYFDMDADDAQVKFEQLAPWLKAKVEASPEWTAKKTEGLVSEDPAF